MRALKGAGIISAVIVGAAAFIFLLAVYLAGLLWISNNVLDYLNIAAVIAFAICVFVFLPLSLFRVTRNVSVYGFYISSVIFGVATWILGFLVTFQHWGVTGLLVGLFLAGVGVVPIGILASAFNASWPQVGDLALGLVLTFGARMTAATLAAKADHDEVVMISNSQSEPAPIDRSAICYATDKWRAMVRFDRIQSQQIIMTALFMLVVGGLAVYEALHPSRSNYDYLQLVANLNAHPIASVFGALLPAVILSPLAYWMFGWILRRNAARFKICEHCAETIKAQAKVCRYCGRDVEVEVGARQRSEEEQYRPGANANQIEYVQAVPPLAAPASTIGARDRGPELRTLPLLSRRALVIACMLGFFLFGSAGVWLTNTQRASAPPGIPPFDELPGAPITAGKFEDATAAYARGDYATALRSFRSLAVQGNSAAQNKLGSMYSNGKGVPRNDTEAVKWFHLAADLNNVVAQNNLGVAYENGLGVSRNSAEAERWYRRAADRGFVDAQFNLGQMYFAGPVEMQNTVEAMKWFGRAAGRGNANAQYFLGMMYANGSGVTKDYLKAYIWTSLALAQGDSVVRDTVEKLRDLVEQSLTPAQLAQAKRFLQYKSTYLLSDADVALLTEASAQKQSGQAGVPPARDGLPDAPQPRAR
jgi:hypothetical protein